MLHAVVGKREPLGPQVEADLGTLVDVDVDEAGNAGLGGAEVQLEQRLWPSRP